MASNSSNEIKKFKLIVFGILSCSIYFSNAAFSQQSYLDLGSNSDRSLNEKLKKTSCRDIREQYEQIDQCFFFHTFRESVGSGSDVCSSEGLDETINTVKQNLAKKTYEFHHDYAKLIACWGTLDHSELWSPNLSGPFAGFVIDTFYGITMPSYTTLLVNIGIEANPDDADLHLSTVGMFEEIKDISDDCFSSELTELRNYISDEKLLNELDKLIAAPCDQKTAEN